MFKTLFHFARYPPGLKKFGQLTPQSNDLWEELLPLITLQARELYQKDSFVYTIPHKYLEKWRETGQLQSLWDMIVGLDWFNRSLEQWRINAETLDLSSALIRETYLISPQALGTRDVFVSSEVYNQRYAQMINSVQPLTQYQKNFINPEVLLPFPVSLDLMTLEKVIE